MQISAVTPTIPQFPTHGAAPAVAPSAADGDGDHDNGVESPGAKQPGVGERLDTKA